MPSGVETLQRHPRYPVEARGRITAVRIINGVPGAPSLARETERLLQAMPRWQPARKGKRRVAAEVQMGVVFGRR